MTVEYNPFTPEVKADPYPYYAALRKEAPVYRVPGTAMYAVSRYADVAELLTQPELFSSAGMRVMLLGGFGASVGMKAAAGGPSADDAGNGGSALPSPEILAQLSRDLPFSFQELLTSRNVIMADPPGHTPLRGIVNRGFTPRRIAALEGRIREMADEAIHRIRDKREFDLVAELSTPIPVQVIAELLGVEPERRDDFKRWSDAIVAGVSGSAAGTNPPQFISAFGELMQYFKEVVETRRRNPRSDLVSVIVAAQEGETKLTDLEVVMFAVLLLAAGNETTTNLIGNAVLALLEYPDQMKKVRADPGLIPDLVEETLRYDSPVQALFRQVSADAELAGTKLPAGSIVLPLFASANRDEAQFPDPDRFDVERDMKGHLAFGYGVHFCLGASLARLEARVCLEALLAKLPPFRLCQGNVEQIDSFLLRGPRSLQLTWADV
ncbi:MAG: cytochrome P450 [Myxococcota bacterium]